MAKDQSRAEQREFVKVIEDLRREIRSEMRALKKSVQLTSDSCNEMKEIGRNVKELMREVKQLNETNQEQKTIARIGGCGTVPKDKQR